jgi:hypothetical protein
LVPTYSAPLRVATRRPSPCLEATGHLQFVSGKQGMEQLLPLLIGHLIEVGYSDLTSSVRPAVAVGKDLLSGLGASTGWCSLIPGHGDQCSDSLETVAPGDGDDLLINSARGSVTAGEHPSRANTKPQISIRSHDCGGSLLILGGAPSSYRAITPSCVGPRVRGRVASLLASVSVSARWRQPEAKHPYADRVPPWRFSGLGTFRERQLVRETPFQGRHQIDHRRRRRNRSRLSPTP